MIVVELELAKEKKGLNTHDIQIKTGKYYLAVGVWGFFFIGGGCFLWFLFFFGLHMTLTLLQHDITRNEYNTLYRRRVFCSLK